MIEARWPLVPLRRVAEVIDCAHVTAEFVDDDPRFPIASIRECGGSTVDLSGCNYTTREFFDLLRASGRAPYEGDLLFIRNVSVGLVSVVAPGTPEFAVGQETVLLRRSAGGDPRFLRYALTAKTAQYAIEGAMIGSTFRRINVSAIRSLPVPLPPSDEQRAIADYLDNETAQIDELIAEQQRLIDLLRERRGAVVGLAIAGINANRAALRYFARLVSGSGFPVQAQGQSGQELPFFKVKDLKTSDATGVLVAAEDTVSRETAVTLRATVIPKGSLVFAKVGAAVLLGRVGALPVDGCIDNNMAALICEPTLDPTFARYLVRTFDFPKFVQPGAVPSLNMEGLREFRVPVISLAEQRRIAASVDAQTARIDALILEAEHVIVLSKKRRSALITAAVTGQLDVRKAA